jgi:quinolinate synthase
MAETAKLLNPGRIVLIPDAEAGCSLAESITAADMRALRVRHPGVPIVTYVNTSAAVKAEADICCTSANAKQIVESLGAPRVIMAPDGYLARNVAATTQVEIIPWEGRCEVHERFTGDDIRTLRADYGDIVVLAHPECAPEVLAASDYAGSTAGMANYIATRKPKRAALITECSMSANLAAENPGTELVQPCNLCPHMKKITLGNIRRALETLTTQVEVPADIAAAARRSVERMIAVGVK